MRRIILLILMYILIGVDSYSQSIQDENLIEEAKIAIDKYNDCIGAKAALERVSVTGQKDLFYIFYYAKACECTKFYEKAIIFYTEYNEKKQDPSIRTKINELNYLARKQRMECKKCKGKGSIERSYNCDRSDCNSGDVVCRRCKGEGKYCKTCGDCSACGGDGQVDCSLCDGKGTYIANIDCDHH